MRGLAWAALFTLGGTGRHPVCAGRTKGGGKGCGQARTQSQTEQIKTYPVVGVRLPIFVGDALDDHVLAHADLEHIGVREELVVGAVGGAHLRW